MEKQGKGGGNVDGKTFHGRWENGTECRGRFVELYTWNPYGFENQYIQLKNTIQSKEIRANKSMAILLNLEFHFATCLYL